jgi:nitroimidazol reductase NimA-like FMN-containing flavoprotein (pyridoxamine 5'-phosphate oxidase superfamily)
MPPSADPRPRRPRRRPPTHGPRIRGLRRSECDALLARNHVGRVAFGRHDWVTIEPLHYVVADRWIYGRTSAGHKLDVLAHNPWVAFEVDEIAGLFDWRSVVVHGGWYRQLDAPPREAEAWAEGIARLRALISGTLTSDDPTSFRDVVFRIEMADVTGRASRSRA